MACSHHSCNQVVRAAGYCNAHYLRSRNGRDMDAPIAPRYRGATCTAFGCAYKVVKKDLCDAHYQRVARGLPANLPVDRRDVAATSYQAVHRRTRGIKGSAAMYPCEGGCGSNAAEWAYSGADPNQLYDEAYNAYYSLNTEYYDAMCVRCHRRRDRTKASEGVREYRRWKQATGLTLAEDGASTV